MLQSAHVLEWQAEGERKGLVKGRVESLLRLLQKGFRTEPLAFTERLQGTTDMG
jgi:hypothetical protein